MKYYEVLESQTSKPIGSHDNKIIEDSGFRVFHQDKHEFKTMAEVKEFLYTRYGKCKRSKMYQDNKEGQSRHVGYIYHFKNYEWGEKNQKKWFWQQDWIEVREIKSTTVLVTA